MAANSRTCRVPTTFAAVIAHPVDQEAFRIASLIQGDFIPRLAGSVERLFQEAWREPAPRAVIVHEGLPGLVLRDCVSDLRQDTATRGTVVLAILCSGEEAHLEAAFAAGVGDLVVEPFTPHELLVRLRRITSPPLRIAHENRVRAGCLDVDLVRGRATIGRTSIPLSHIECRLLAELASRPGIVFEKETIITSLWGMASDVAIHTLDSHICNLRRKLGRSRAVIETVHGRGYLLELSRARRGK